MRNKLLPLIVHAQNKLSFPLAAGILSVGGISQLPDLFYVNPRTIISHVLNSQCQYLKWVELGRMPFVGLKVIKYRPPLWYSWLNHCLQCWHPIWTSIRVLIALLLIQLSIKMPVNAEDNPSNWAPTAMWETQVKPPASGFCLAQLWQLQPFGE